MAVAKDLGKAMRPATRSNHTLADRQPSQRRRCMGMYTHREPVEDTINSARKISERFSV